MKLTNINLTGFRSIKGLEKVRIDEKITVLIGANDHGKSNILDAIKALNDDSPFVADDKNWDLPDDKKVSVEWHFQLDEKDNLLEKLKELEEKVEDEEVEESEEEPVEAEAIQTTQELTEAPGEENGAETEAEEEQQSEPEEEQSFFPTNKENELVFYREGIGDSVKVKSVPVDNIAVDKEELLLEMRPRVELFEAPKSNLIDKVNAKQLATDEFEFMQGIFRLAGLWEHKDTIFSDNVKSSRLLDEASERLTKVLNKEWNQGKNLEWKLKHTGTNGDHIEIRIQDPAISSRYTYPSTRSSGFRTYFLTSMVISARTANNKSHSYIYMFDEPGIYLHPHA